MAKSKLRIVAKLREGKSHSIFTPTVKEGLFDSIINTYSLVSDFTSAIVKRGGKVTVLDSLTICGDLYINPAKKSFDQWQKDKDYYIANTTKYTTITSYIFETHDVSANHDIHNIIETFKDKLAYIDFICDAKYGEVVMRVNFNNNQDDWFKISKYIRKYVKYNMTADSEKELNLKVDITNITGIIMKAVETVDMPVDTNIDCLVDLVIKDVPNKAYANDVTYEREIESVKKTDIEKYILTSISNTLYYDHVYANKEYKDILYVPNYMSEEFVPEENEIVTSLLFKSNNNAK